MFTRARHIALACAFACVSAGVLPAPAAAEWRRLDSPNFTVIGDVGERQLRDVAVQFEGFRETLSRVVSERATATAVPTVVIVFPHDRAFTPYKPLYKGRPVSVAGVFYGGADLNYITLVLDGRPGSMRVIFHEYAHLVISNLAMNLPVWLNEGLAEYYSTYEVSRGGQEAEIGRPIDSHVHLLREQTLVAVERLTTVDRGSPLYNEADRRSVFYAQSWALTHMLLLGDPPRAKELAAYIRQLERGVPANDAWRQAFGDARIDQELARYVRRQSFRAYAYRFTDKFAAFDAGSSMMSQPDVSAFVAGLRLRQGRQEDAAAQVSQALAANERHPHANVVKAQLDLERGDYDSVARRLVPLGVGDDWFVAYLAGVTLTDAIERGRAATAERLAAGRVCFDAVRRVREVPNALANRAMLDLLSSDGPNAESRAAIERARALAPGRDDYVLIHARVLAETGEFALARKLLGPMLAPGFPPHVRETARQWLGNMVRLEARRRSDGAGGAPPAGGERPTLPSSSQAIPIYRAVKTDEHRMEGLLEGIACPAAPPAVFHVRTDEGAQKLYAPRLADVEFITYREDLSGEVVCGTLKTPMRVFVTWKTGPRAGEKHVVAIEFLR